MSLLQAIEQLEAEIATYGQGSSGQPAEGTAEWFILRAKAVGLTCLLKMKQAKVEGNTRAAQLIYRDAVKDAQVEVTE